MEKLKKELMKFFFRVPGGVQKLKQHSDIFTGLNDCLETYNYHLPIPEDIFAKLSGGRVFSRLNLSEAYLQIPVDKECVKYLNIKTYKGLYRFNRLPFGIMVAPGIFQQIMNMLLNDVNFATVYLN